MVGTPSKIPREQGDHEAIWPNPVHAIDSAVIIRGSVLCLLLRNYILQLCRYTQVLCM